MNVLGEEEDLLILKCLFKARESLEESVSRWSNHIKVQGLEDFFFHVYYLVSLELIFTYRKQVSKVWRINLLVLGRNEKGSDTKKMKLRLLDMLFAEILIDEMRSDIQALRNKSEFPVNINNPLEQECP